MLLDASTRTNHHSLDLLNSFTVRLRRQPQRLCDGAARLAASDFKQARTL